MRKLLLFIWLLLPAGAAAYHYGPGQDRTREDRASDAAARAEDCARRARATAATEGDAAARELWAQAALAYETALEELPAGSVTQSRLLRLERAKAQMFLSKLPDAHREFSVLVDELESDPTADPKLLADARGALANAQYYRTWLMRLEGVPAEEWEPEIEASRQNYKLLAEKARAAGEETLAQANQENLESAIRLARMDLKDLQGLPLPSQ